ncbi:MAG: nucleoside deaminase [Actinomycetota bacterium]|nr:nucleoside deaminase [Actinomycetota bacterium]MDA8208770.1 nucleoside deaminase [Actinomycetota bacterium]
MEPVPFAAAFDEAAMQAAIDEASAAAAKGEVPIGAVVVRNGEIIARAHNLRETDRNPLAHAEILAIGAAAQMVGAWRLSDCEIYCTLEPCPMCAGAIVAARMRGLYFGAYDPKAGAVSSLYGMLSDPRLNHETPWTGGVREGECGDLLSGFFDSLRTD